MQKKLELQKLIEKLLHQKQTLTTAESCTGGMIGQWITSITGSSKVYQGGVIAYSNEVKEKILHVPTQILKKHGAVSEPTAFFMAKGAQKILTATWAISVTGIAGPDGGTTQKPVGLICFGLAGPNGILTKQIILKDQGRQSNRKRASQIALEWLYAHLKSHNQIKHH